LINALLLEPVIFFQFNDDLFVNKEIKKHFSDYFIFELQRKVA